MILLTEYIYDCELQDSKTFTQTLKMFQRMFRKYPRLEPKEAKHLFDSCADLFRTNRDPTIQFNAIRLAKFAVTSTRYMQKHAHEVWQLYKETIFHSNGQVRRAGVQLVARYYFGIVINIDPDPTFKIKVPKRKQEELKKFLMFNYLHLIYLEEKYMTKYNLWPTQEERKNTPEVFLAVNTKDKFLKNIRMGIESFGNGRYMGEIMAENGYAH